MYVNVSRRILLACILAYVVKHKTMYNREYILEEIKIKDLLNRIRLLMPEIGTYVGHAGSYENLLNIGINVTNGWLFVTRIELEKRHTLDNVSLKRIVERFEER